ncbi:MAG: WGR domain-containing protein [Candidatus Thorarchaeota archaeon]
MNEETGKPKSAKFWIGWCEGSTFYVRYGRIGTDGTVSNKKFDSLEEAEKACASKTRSKVKKGYKLV